MVSYLIVFRHPFERFYSAWNDKFSNRSSEARQQRVLQEISLFERSDLLPKPGYASTFTAFAEWVASTSRESVHNRHWQSQTRNCHPCLVKYNYITHLAHVHNESRALFKLFSMENTYIPQVYRKSPSKYHKPEYYWKNVSDKTKKLLYRFYYLDFIFFDYDFESFR